MPVLTRTSSPQRALELRKSASPSRPIIVTPGFGGKGYVVVDGFLELRAALKSGGGVANVVLQGSGLAMKIRRKENGDLVEVTPPRRVDTTAPA